jgi:hypothetical protein
VNRGEVTQTRRSQAGRSTTDSPRVAAGVGIARRSYRHTQRSYTSNNVRWGEAVVSDDRGVRLAGEPVDVGEPKRRRTRGQVREPGQVTILFSDESVHRRGLASGALRYEDAPGRR